MSVPRLSEAQEVALLDHAHAMHGLDVVDCPRCAGLGCATCNGHGTVYTVPRATCSDPDCALTARMAAIAAKERS